MEKAMRHCDYCGKEYEYTAYTENWSRFCGDTCRQRAYRAEKRASKAAKKQRSAALPQPEASDRLQHLNTAEAHFSRIFFALDDLLDVDVTDIDAYQAAYEKLNRRLTDVHVKLLHAKKRTHPAGS